MSGEFVVFDTDVASASIRGRLAPSVQARFAVRSHATTFVTLGELTKWAIVRGLGDRRRAALARWLHRVVMLAYDPVVAVTWGELQARASQRGRPRPANDSWIAACCLAYDMPLATFNTKDFTDYAEHEGLKLVEL